MNIGLVGFGKTGRAVAGVLLEAKNVNLRWVLRRSKSLEQRSAGEFLDLGPQGDGEDDGNGRGLIFSAENTTAGELLDRYPVDAIVDFSSPEGVVYYGAEAAHRNVAIVTAVSQYPHEMLRALDRLARRTRVVHSPNITIGINFLMIAARVLKNIAPQTDIEIIEEHFKNKPEISGTARVIARHLDIKDESIKSVRAGSIIGTHEILFGLPNQTVRLKHESISREAFGNGILFALENLPHRRNGLYTMEDLLAPYFELGNRGSRREAAGHKPWWKLW